MEVVSVKFQEGILKKIDDSIHQHNFNSRTEFIREAIRDKLNCLNRDQLINEFFCFNGKSKKKTTFKENKRTKEEVSKDIMVELEKRFK